MRADLALIGFGNVGRRFARLLDERRRRLQDEYDLSCRIVGVATARHGAAFDAAGLDIEAPLTSAFSSFDVIDRLRTSGADMRVVVETTTLNIADGRPAIDHIRAAVAAGCHVVTANKGPAAFAYADLQAAADAAGVAFLFEGAVMDGIPVFNLARETLGAVDVIGFRGIVNTTTNVIIGALEKGEAFAPALARMQAEGIAEADPSLDLDGWDAAAKTAALANVLMGARITPHDVVRAGIGKDTGDRVRAALDRGRRLRLVASAERQPDGSVRAAVQPTELTADDLLAGIHDTANALVLRTDLLGDLAICQLSGDLTQTAYALLSDLITIRRRQGARAASAHRIP